MGTAFDEVMRQLKAALNNYPFKSPLRISLTNLKATED